MTQKNDGGPAFPQKRLYRDGQGIDHEIHETGMTLRDYFAGQALAGIMGPNYDWFTSGTETGSRTHEAAFFAYSLADAMLAARDKD